MGPQLAEGVTLERFAERLAHADVIEGGLLRLEREVIHRHHRARGADEMGILLGNRLRPIAVHVGMGEHVRPEDALAQDRRHERLRVRNEMDLERLKKGPIFLKVLRVALVLPQRQRGRFFEPKRSCTNDRGF